MIPFVQGAIYNRRQDIHAPYGGQQQGGIATPAKFAMVFAFDSPNGDLYGYEDGCQSDGTYRYTGEGVEGDMRFERGNAAIRDHSKNGKSLYVFKSVGKGKGYRFEGEFVCSSWTINRRDDCNGKKRDCIDFTFVPLSAINKNLQNSPLPSGTIQDLRLAAVLSSGPAARKDNSSSTVFERSEAVKNYVLARANGVCESCKAIAPFVKIDGSPFLECHHTSRLSDGGPDDPKSVGAVCPNCHREIHHGVNGEARNQKLISFIAQVEAVFSTASDDE